MRGGRLWVLYVGEEYFNCRGLYFLELSVLPLSMVFFFIVFCVLVSPVYSSLVSHLFVHYLISCSLFFI